MIRIFAFVSLLAILPSCASTGHTPEYPEASPILQEEIDMLLRELPYRHGPELIATLKRLIYIGEPAIPSIVRTLRADHPKSRSNAAYEIRDRRVIPKLRKSLDDSAPGVRYEVAASLLILGDWSGIPILIEALGDEDPYHRYKAIGVLANHTHQDLGYDYRAAEVERTEAVGRWENWYAALERRTVR